MNLWILSDLHLNATSDLAFPRAPEDADAVIIAGDLDGSIAAGAARLERAAKADPVLQRVPIVYVPGNHEFEGSDIAWSTAAGLLAASRCSIDLRVLSRSTTIIGPPGHGVMVIGATLWTDFALEGDRHEAMQIAARSVWDYKAIKTTCGLPFTPTHAIAQHEMDRDFISRALSAPKAMRRIVVTHHLPSARSIAPRFAAWPTNPSYASRLEPRIETSGPDLWVHGHTHASLDYSIRATRIVCNAHGYMKGGRRENETFNEGFTIAIDPDPLRDASEQPAKAG
jgi:predicted phosphodiesterase